MLCEQLTAERRGEALYSPSPIFVTKGVMLDISFWLRFPLLLNHPDFVAAALEECRAAIRVTARQNSELRLDEWKRRFTALAQNPESTVRDLEECTEDFHRLQNWVDTETMRVLMRSLTFSYSTVRMAYKELQKAESFERIAGLHRILTTASERCKEDKTKVRGAEYSALHK